MIGQVSIHYRHMIKLIIVVNSLTNWLKHTKGLHVSTFTISVILFGKR